MSVKLFLSAITKYILGVLLVGLLVFIPAGDLEFTGGWIFMGVLFPPMLFAGVVMMIKDPALLARRLDAKEKQKDQDTVVKLSGLMFVLGFVIAGLDYRFDIFQLPMWVTVAATVLFLLSYVMYAEVLRENSYLSRTIKVEEGQRVIDTGLYGIVRHPLYRATLLLFMSMPLVLGSLISFAVFLAYPFIIAKRIKGEENLLEAELAGYTEYKNKVKYRLIPFVR